MEAGFGGFRRLVSGPRVLVVDPEFEPAVRELGLLEAGGLEALLRDPAGPPGRATTSVLTLPGRRERLLVRPLRHGGRVGPILRGAFLGLARPLAELSATARLRKAGAPVPRPAFVWGQRTLGPVHEAAIATVVEDEAVDALVFLRSAPSAHRIQAAAAAAGRAVRALHDAGGRHADLHVKNLLLREGPDAPPECIVIDLDKARVVAEVTPRNRMEELARLYRSLLKRGVIDAVGPRGCASFFAAYTRGDRSLRRDLRRHADRERRRVALHALFYRR